MAVLTRLVLVAVLVTSGSVEGVRLSMSFSTSVAWTTPILTIRCEADAEASDPVNALRITKPPSTTNLAILDSNGTRVDSSIQQRATATGTLSPAAKSYLVLNLTHDITCSDAGEYSCQYSSQNTQGQMDNQTPQETSQQIYMVANPNMFFYRVNDTVKLVCTGFLVKSAVGSWVWETRDASVGSTWTPLRPGLTPVDETPAEYGLCRMTGRSTLTFPVQMDDGNRTYRCYFRDPTYSAKFTFNVRGPAEGDANPSARLYAGAAVAISLVLTFLLLWE